MSFLTFTYNLLAGDAALTALVPVAHINMGSNAQEVPEPVIFVDVLSSNLAPIMENGKPGAARNDNYTIQVACYARTLAQAWTISDRVRFVLEASGNPCKYICHAQENARDDFSDLNGVILRLSAWYQSTTPAS